MTTMNFANWNWRHTAVMAGSMVAFVVVTFFTSALEYIQHEPAATLMAAIGSVSVARTVVIGASVAGLTQLVALAQHSFSAPVVSIPVTVQPTVYSKTADTIVPPPMSGVTTIVIKPVDQAAAESAIIKAAEVKS